MLLSNHDCIVTKLSERSRRLFGAFKGSEMEFSTKTLIVCCGYGKMCLHAFENWILGCKKKSCLWKCMTFLLHSALHTLTLAHTTLLSAHCMTGRGSGKHWTAYSSRVIGSSWDGLSSVVTKWRYRGDEMGWIRGDFTDWEKGRHVIDSVIYLQSLTHQHQLH